MGAMRQNRKWRPECRTALFSGLDVLESKAHSPLNALISVHQLPTSHVNQNLQFLLWSA